MKPSIELKLQAFLDQELPPADAQEVTELIERDPQWRSLFQELQTTKSLISQNEPEAPLTETRDWYWKGIHDRLEDTPAVERTRGSLALSWAIRWALPIAGATALFAAMLIRSGTSTIDPFHHEVETSLDQAKLISFYAPQAGMTVFWVDTQ